MSAAARERFWGKGMAGDKEAAFATLYHILETMSRLTAPFTPFMAESMYRNLVCSIDKDAPILRPYDGFPRSATSGISTPSWNSTCAICWRSSFSAAAAAAKAA